MCGKRARILEQVLGALLVVESLCQLQGDGFGNGVGGLESANDFLLDLVEVDGLAHGRFLKKDGEARVGSWLGVSSFHPPKVWVDEEWKFCADMDQTIENKKNKNMQGV